jgi:hypothetical protein
VPAAPGNFVATPGNGLVDLSWTTPNDGGSPITRYEVSSNNGSTWVTASGAGSHTFTGLTNGQSYTFKVRAVNAIGAGAEASATATPVAPVIVPPAPVISTLAGALAGGTVGLAYSATLAATNSPSSWALASGSLPNGLTFNPATGTISGTPTTAGTFNFTITATNEGGASTVVAFSITISVGTANEAIETNGLKAYAANGILYVEGLPAGQTLRVYSMTGALVYTTSLNSSKKGEQFAPSGEGSMSFPLPARGIYIVTDGQKTIKVMN